MKEYILNIEFGTWKNQLWFINSYNSETEEKWNEIVKKINDLKNSYHDAMEFQTGIIDYLESFGFIRIQK